MKNILKIVLFVLAIVLAYFIYDALQSDISFKKKMENRYTSAIGQLEDVANAEKLYKTANGKYTDNLDSLKNYVENGNIIVINRIDSSAYVYDSRKRIDVMKSFTVYDTVISPTSVKDSIFGNSDRYKDFGFVVAGKKKLPIKFYASFNDQVIGEDSTNVQRDHFFKGHVTKRDVLNGLEPNLITREMFNDKSLIKDTIISVGSDYRPSLEGNWANELDVMLADKRNKEQKRKLRAESKRK